MWADEVLHDAPLDAAASRRCRRAFDELRTEVLTGQYLDLRHAADRSVAERTAARVALLKSARYTVSRPLLLLIGIIFLIQFSTQMLTPVMPIYIKQLAGDVGNVATIVGVVLGIGGVGSAIGAIVLGRLAIRDPTFRRQLAFPEGDQGLDWGLVEDQDREAAESLRAYWR